MMILSNRSSWSSLFLTRCTPWHERTWLWFQHMNSSSILALAKILLKVSDSSPHQSSSLSLSLSPPPLPFVSILLTPIVVFVTKMVYSQVNQYKNVVSSTPLVVPQSQVVAWPQHRHSNIDVVHLSLLYIMQLGGKIRMLLPSSMLMIWYHDLCVLFCCCCFCCCDIHINI